MKWERQSRHRTALGTAIVGAVLVLGTGAAWLHGARGVSAQPQQPTDAPERVRLTPAERETIRRDMQTMMRSLSLLLQGLADSNVALMEQAARTSGKAIALDPQLVKTLPAPYVQLDQKVHLRFDQLADTMKGRTAAPTVVTRLAAITGYCVACHSMFRLD
jgi:hypothetical protein